MLTLNRNSNIPLSIQLKDVLLSGIRRGSLQINQRLPGERTLAKEYGVSRGTVIESLRILETQGYINRIEAKGTFVSANARLRAGTKKILFPFPASSLSIDCLGFSNWCASTEIYRGLIEGAMSYGLQLNMQFFDENQERIETYLNIKDADDFDAVFFISHQLSRLRKIIEERNIPHTVFLNRLDIDSKSYIYYKRLEGILKLAEYIIEKGCKKIGLLRFVQIGKENQEKIDLLTNTLTDNGVKIADDWTFYLEDDKEKAFAKLKKEFPNKSSKMPDFFFCESMCHPFALYRLMAELGIRIGEDVSVVSHGSVMAFESLLPNLTYLRIPYFEMGKEAARLLNDAINNQDSPKIGLPAAELIEGESVKI